MAIFTNYVCAGDGMFCDRTERQCQGYPIERDGNWSGRQRRHESWSLGNDNAPNNRQREPQQQQRQQQPATDKTTTMTLHWFTFRTVSWQVGDRSLKAVHRVHRCLGTRQHVPGIPLQGRNSRPLSSSFQGSYNDRDHTIWVHSENISLSSGGLSPWIFYK